MHTRTVTPSSKYILRNTSDFLITGRFLSPEIISFGSAYYTPVHRRTSISPAIFHGKMSLVVALEH
jgi:hypothetical protein